MTAQEAASDAGVTVLDRHARPHGPIRRALRNALHFLSYHFVLSRPKTQVSRAAGFRLTVPPTVFHPGFFISSEAYAKFVDGLDLSGMTVADVGTGSGIIALAAARAGASTVIATDINPNAASAAAENAEANGLKEKVSGLCCNLLEAIEPKPVFDVIMSSPPKHAGEPKDLADAGWHAGAGNRNILNLFEQARQRLKPGGRVYLMISSDSDLDMYGKAIAKAGFKARLAFEHSIMFEIFSAVRTHAVAKRPAGDPGIAGGLCLSRMLEPESDADPRRYSYADARSPAVTAPISSGIAAAIVAREPAISIRPITPVPVDIRPVVMVVDGVPVDHRLRFAADFGFQACRAWGCVCKSRHCRHCQGCGHQGCARHGFLQHDGLTFRWVRDAHGSRPFRKEDTRPSRPFPAAHGSIRHSCIKISRKRALDTFGKISQWEDVKRYCPWASPAAFVKSAAMYCEGV